MRKIQGLLAAATASLALAGTAAHADTVWDFSFNDIATGTSISGSGSFTTTASGDITALSGFYSDANAHGSMVLIPAATTGGVQNTSADGLYYYDNSYGASGFDIDGLLFTAGAEEVNLYLDGTMNIVTHSANGYTTTPVDLTVTAVPEPGPMAMLLAGIAALGFVSRRKARA